MIECLAVWIIASISFGLGWALKSGIDNNNHQMR